MKKVIYSKLSCDLPGNYLLLFKLVLLDILLCSEQMDSYSGKENRKHF